VRQAIRNPELRRKIAAWFKEERNLDGKAEEIRCTWCKGDRSGHGVGDLLDSQVLCGWEGAPILLGVSSDPVPSPTLYGGPS